MTTEAPNCATVTLAQPHAGASAYRPRPEDFKEKIEVFKSYRFEAGVLIFEFQDGAIRAYCPGQWVRVDMCHIPEGGA
jgi:hypothetical protein